MTGKRDLKKELGCYRATAAPQLVQVPELRYLMIDGHGDPNSAAFAEAVATLYPVAYALKFASRRALDRDYVVMPLEGLWWAQDMQAFTTARDKSQWHWTLMTMVPDWVTDAMFTAARTRVGGCTPPARLGELRFESLVEGRCVQALHVGSFDEEGALLQQIHHEFIPAHRLRMTGRHHEIYLSDFRRVEPARRRTILRQPVGPHPADTSADTVAGNSDLQTTSAQVSAEVAAPTAAPREETSALRSRRRAAFRAETERGNS